MARKTNLQRLRQGDVRFFALEVSQADRLQQRLENVAVQRANGHRFGRGRMAASIGEGR